MRSKAAAIMLAFVSIALIGFWIAAFKAAPPNTQSVFPAGIAMTLGDQLVLVPFGSSDCLRADDGATAICTLLLNNQTITVRTPSEYLLGFASNDPDRRCSVVYADRSLPCRSIVPSNYGVLYVLIREHGIPGESLQRLRLEHLPLNLSESEWLWGMTLLSLLIGLSVGTTIYQYFVRTYMRKGIRSVFCATVSFAGFQFVGFLLLLHLKLIVI